MFTLQHIAWVGDAQTGFLRLLDQTQLPASETYIDCRTVQSVWDAIKCLSVRGAPAIGIAAAYGCVIAQQEGDLVRGADHLAISRPTAVNLVWATERMKRVEPRNAQELLTEARRIHQEDVTMCRRIGEHTLGLIEQARMQRHALELEETSPGILTHCNAGALATGGIGTATAGMYLAHQQNRKLRIFADETRPLLQGSRLTAYELAACGLDVTLICDDMAAQVMREGRIDLVITGADRIAANGDTANKIGTYNLAVLAQYHNIPFYIAAPSTTFDLSIGDGSQIPIEQRAAEEITEGFGKRTAPQHIRTYSPAFDVTPHELITAIITENGVIQPVNTEHIARVLRIA